MGIELTSKAKKVKTPSDRIAIVYQIRATEDFDVTIFDGTEYKVEHIRKGDLGGYVEKNVMLGRDAWLFKNAIIFGNSRFNGVACGFTRIDSSTINRGAIIAGRAIIISSFIGNSTTIAGTTSIKNSRILSGSLIVGTVIRFSKIHSGTTIKCAGVIAKEEVSGVRTLIPRHSKNT
ncbi:hypothetical protein IKG33_02220 [Candidatus Saccharibacteria bacterium]|nr:hypothetical protein [Candidatus Saccharibacteria bacterium]